MLLFQSILSLALAVGDYEIEDVEDHVPQHFRIRHRTNLMVAIAAHQEHVPLPTVKVLGTGGTIALKGLLGLQTAGYKVDLTIEELVGLIPDLGLTCNLEYEQVLNVDSKEINTKELLMLYEKVRQDIEEYDGIVITHGTDTMEETAFFLQLTIDTSKPIVMCGLMRPLTAILSDGPMNLYQAISIALHLGLHGRGLLVALNDRIGNGFYITKSNANLLDTFKLIGQGYVGNFVNNEIHYYYPPNKPIGLRFFDVNLHHPLPEVVIIYAHQGINNKLIEVILTSMDIQGVVLATMGAGSMADSTNELIARLTRDSQIPVVYLKRLMDGMVPTAAVPTIVADDIGNHPYLNGIAGGYLNPQKARILLQLCLNNNLALPQIREIFKKM